MLDWISQAEIETPGRNINNLRYADDTTLMAESEEELKSPLMKVKEESEKVGLNVNIKKTKISSGYSCHLFFISSDSFQSIPFLSFIVSIFA